MAKTHEPKPTLEPAPPKPTLDPASDDYRLVLNHVARTRDVTHWAAHQLLTRELDHFEMLAEARAAIASDQVEQPIVADAATDVETTTAPESK